MMNVIIAFKKIGNIIHYWTRGGREYGADFKIIFFQIEEILHGGEILYTCSIEDRQADRSSILGTLKRYMFIRILSLYAGIKNFLILKKESLFTHHNFLLKLFGRFQVVHQDK